MKSFLPPDWSSKEHDPVPLVIYFELCVCELSLFSDRGWEVKVCVETA